MGKKKAAAGLGRALLRERGRARGGRGAGWLHASQAGGGDGGAEAGPQSVTERSSLEEFLATAELAGTEFAAERLHVRLVPAQAPPALPTAQEARSLEALQERHRRFLRVPRRPHWDKQTSSEMLNQAERDDFLKWRRQLAQLEEEQKLLLTPFERSLEFWRQLWRVLERRFPPWWEGTLQKPNGTLKELRGAGLLEQECYVKELSPAKENLVLLNKADLLSEEQRSAWAHFFEGEGVRVVFWSALAEGRRLEAGLQETNAVELPDPSQEEQQAARRSSGGRLGSSPWPLGSEEHDSSQEDDSDTYEDCEEDAWLTCSEDEAGGTGTMPERQTCDAVVQEPVWPIRNSSCLVPRDELLEILKAVHTGKTVREGEVTVGLVGYPNVGKSSTINTILGKKKVSVSATPGHTKHFQTLYVEPGLRLCDCPGLVMPSFVSTKAEMTCSGILPIDQLRDHVPPISLVCQRIPRHVLETTYGIHIVRPREDEAPDRPPTAEELLTAYGCMRGFMTDHGQVDQPRSARCVLKDYVRGKLLYCHPPPGVDAKDFQCCQERNSPSKGGAEVQPGWNPKAKQIENVVDKAFFHQENVRALTRGVQAVMGSRAGDGPAVLLGESPGKPWKKHGNRNKKEKIRRITKHLEA